MKKSSSFNKRNLAGGVGAALLLVGASVNAGAIDEFTTLQTPVFSQEIGVGAGSQAGSDTDTSILGGYRNLYVEMVSGEADPPNPFTAVSIGVVNQVPFGGLLNFSNAGGVTGYGEIVWQGNNEYYDAGTGTKTLIADGLGGADITAGGTLTDFLIETISADAGWNFEIYMYADATNYTVINFPATPGPGVNTIPFSSFTDFCPVGIPFPPGGGVVNSITCVGTGADPTNVGALRAVLNIGADGDFAGGTVDIDLRLGSVTTVPEPATLALMGLGLLAAGGLGMRRRNKMNA